MRMMMAQQANLASGSDTVAGRTTPPWPIFGLNVDRRRSRGQLFRETVRGEQLNDKRRRDNRSEYSRHPLPGFLF